MSFQSALSGLNAAAMDLNVTGNNIANGQTVGFKGSRAEFADIFATSHLGIAQNAVGQGVRVSNVQQMFQQGQFDFTGNALDMGVAGEGFFRMDNNGQISYTRAGNFQIDKNGFIVNPDGHKLTGFQVDGNGNVTNALGPIMIGTGDIDPSPTGNMAISANLHAFAQDLSAVPFDPVDDPNSYTYSTSSTVYDSLGRDHMHTYYFRKVGDNEWEVHSRMEGQAAQKVADVTFTAGGRIDQIDNLADLTYNIPGADPITLSFDLNGLTQFGTPTSVSRLTQDGYSAGQFSSLTVESDGTVFARYSNGQSKTLGQVALAKFASPQNLQPNGSNAWLETFSSGGPIMGAPESGDFGGVQAGALEQSNVDIGEQLVKMITAQRSYQANAKMISTQDAITQELMNIRR